MNATRTQPRILATGAAAITVVLWSSAFVAIRSAGAAYSPGALALGRLASGALALGLISVVRQEGLPPRAAWRGILLSGLLWFGLYMVALNWGERRVDAGTAALVVNVGPLLIALLGVHLLGDPMPPRLVAGLAVSFAGAVTVGLSMSSSGGSSVLGVVLCLLAAVAYAAGAVAQKPALGRASALQVTTFGCLIGAVACMPFAGQLVHEAVHAPASATLDMVYLGVFPTALTFTTWAYALARTTATRMGATTYAVPALVVLLSWLLLGEAPGALTLLGGVLCLAGVAVSRSRARGARSATVAAGEPRPEKVPDRTARHQHPAALAHEHVPERGRDAVESHLLGGERGTLNTDFCSAKDDQLPSLHGSLGTVNAPAPTGPPEVLAALGVSFRLHEHPDVITPVEVCAALGVPLERTVKTLAFVTPEDRLLLAALPGHARLRYGALARAAGLRRSDLSPADSGRLARAGMQPGGVCPVSADQAAVVVFDETVGSLGRVHCGSGRPDSSIEVEAAQLVAAVPTARTAPIADLPAGAPE